MDGLRRCVEPLNAGPGRRTRVIRSLLEVRLGGFGPGDSGLELRVLRAVMEAGLPAPVQQFRVRVSGKRYRIDLAYPAEQVAIEVDGWEPHRTRSAFDADRARGNALVAVGWTLLRFTSKSTEQEIAQTVAATLAQLGEQSAV